MEVADPQQMLGQQTLHSFGELRDPLLLPLTIADEDLVLFELHICIERRGFIVREWTERM